MQTEKTGCTKTVKYSDNLDERVRLSWLVASDVLGQPGGNARGRWPSVGAPAATSAGSLMLIGWAGMAVLIWGAVGLFACAFVAPML
jgi:hypothetical protein